MSLWSQIKYAMNSTLGTSEFKPLDKIIEGQRTWGASDVLIKLLTTSAGYFSDTTLGSFTPKVGGSVRVFAFAFAENYVGDSAYLRVYRGDTLVASTSAKITNNGTTPMSIDISITAGEKYTVKGYTSSTTSSLKSVSVCGSLIDASLME